MPSARIKRPGTQTTVQDMGREASWLGAARSGAADADALMIANRLVGNPDSAAGLEMALVGADIEFESPTLVVVTRPARVERGTRSGPVEPWAVQEVLPGEILRIRECAPGARAYLAVAGGFDVPIVLGSRSTQVGAGLGGFEGRPLRAGDAVPIGRRSPRPARAIPPRIREHIDAHARPRRLRFIAGEHREFAEGEFCVLPASDRMGVRLSRLGPMPADAPRGDLPTQPVEPGTIQATPGGELIILGVDGPPTGGYAASGCVALCDLGAVGQLRPGDRIMFEPIAIDAARRAWRDARDAIDRELPPCP